MKITRKILTDLIAKEGFTVDCIAVLRWGFFEYEFGRAKLVATFKPTGTAYSLQSMKQMTKAIKDGKAFFFQPNGSGDYDFGFN